MKTNNSEISQILMYRDAFGFYGGDFINAASGATTPATGYEYFWFLVLADTVVSAYSQPTGAVALNNLDSATVILAGSFIPARLSSITLTSGEILAFQSPLQTAGV